MKMMKWQYDSKRGEWEAKTPIGAFRVIEIKHFGLQRFVISSAIDLFMDYYNTPDEAKRVVNQYLANIADVLAKGISDE